MTHNHMKLARPLQIGLDLDGVCYDFVASVRRYLVTQGHDARKLADAQRWEFFTDWGLSIDEFLDACHDGVDADIVFATGDPFPGTAEAVSRILSAGHEVHIVTDRSFGRQLNAAGVPGDRSREHTVTWLAGAGIDYTSLTISADKTVVPTDLFIEDRDKNYYALDAAGVDVWLIDRPWNQHVNTNRRVATLHDFADVVLARAAA